MPASSGTRSATSVGAVVPGARIDVETMDAELAAAGLHRTGWLTPDETWFTAVSG